MVPVERPAGAASALVLIDATSGAGGLPVDVGEADAYYFAPQKAFGSDGGLWLALLSPAAIERIERARRHRRPLAAGVPLAADARSRTRARSRPTTRRRWRRCSCSPSRSTGCSTAAGSSSCVERTRASSAHLYGWAEASELATPFVADPAKRSLVVGTIDFDDEVDAAALAATLRANGIVDIEPYRKLGRNQLRIGMFPAVEPADVEALTACIDWVLENVDGRDAADEGPGQGEDRRRRRRPAARASSTSSSASTGTTTSSSERIGEFDAILIRSATKLTRRPDRARPSASR